MFAFIKECGKKCGADTLPRSVSAPPRFWGLGLTTRKPRAGLPSSQFAPADLFFCQFWAADLKIYTTGSILFPVHVDLESLCLFGPVGSADSDSLVESDRPTRIASATWAGPLESLCRFGSADANRFVDSGRPPRTALSIQVGRHESP